MVSIRKQNGQKFRMDIYFKFSAMPVEFRMQDFVSRIISQEQDRNNAEFNEDL